MNETNNNKQRQMKQQMMETTAILDTVEESGILDTF